MKTIFKYEIPLDANVCIAAQSGAKLLSVQVQQGKLQAWFELDPYTPIVRHQFTLVGTGHEVPENAGEYVTTSQLNGGALVLHVYYGGEQS